MPCLAATSAPPRWTRSGYARRSGAWLGMTVTIRYIDCGPSMSALLPECGALAEGIDIRHGDADRVELAALLREAQIVLDGHMMIDDALLAGAPRLRSIIFLGTSASSYIDLAAASRRGIVVRTVQNYGDRTVAKHAFALQLAAARGLASMRAGIWAQQEGYRAGWKDARHRWPRRDRCRDRAHRGRVRHARHRLEPLADRDRAALRGTPPRRGPRRRRRALSGPETWVTELPPL